jgi:hypothetical protein
VIGRRAVLVAKQVIRMPSASMILSWAQGWGRSLRTILLCASISHGSTNRPTPGRAQALASRGFSGWMAAHTLSNGATMLCQ